MSIGGAIFALIFLICVTGYTAKRAIGLWSGADEPGAMVAFSLFARSEAVRRGMVRGTVVRLAQLIAIAIMLLTAMLAYDVAGRDSNLFAPLLICALLFLLLATAAFFLQLSIIWFNRPRFLVPPHMRDQVGTLVARRRASG